MKFTEGEWISHIEAGGIGQIQLWSDGDSIEPDAYWVSWVIPPNWTIPSFSGNRRSVWLRGREKEFTYSLFVPRDPSAKAEGWGNIVSTVTRKRSDD